MTESNLRELTAATPAPTPTASEAPAQDHATAGDDTDVLAMVPVRQFVLFPGVVMPITLKDDVAIAAAQHAVRQGLPLGLIMQRGDAGNEPFSPVNLHRVGTVANVLRYVTSPDGEHHLVCQGEQRFRVATFTQERPFLQARIDRVEDVGEADSSDLQARFIHLQGQAMEALQLLPQSSPELLSAVRSMTSASALADFIAAYTDMPADDKQNVLETLDLPRRCELLSSYLAQRIEVLRLSHEIGRQTRASLDERQREVLLREQLATIQRQLGDDENDGKAREIAELAEAINKAAMPEEVDKAARKELRRLERMPEASAEFGMVRTYLDWLIELPWSLTSEPPVDLAMARSVLEADHHGLERIKERIVEFLAVRKLAPEGKAPILCFAGPPGVGKTSLGQSIARAMQRPFVRVSLGGVHDEAEIRGHRRTYLGALPGNIIQGIRKAGSRQCVMMLDEIDKMGSGIQGDPSAAMLEVLDPEQNHTFRDNYLAVPFDLSRVVFIATANMLENIPGPLRDRMEVIHLGGYTDAEKLEIARRYLVPRALESNGLTAEQASFDDDAIRQIIRHYTREAGVRQLERELSRALRKLAVRVAEGQNESVNIAAAQLQELLGAARFEDEVAMRVSMPGVATGMAWTPVGGDILFIEAALAAGSGKLTLTGQLGDVMRESVQAALSLVKSRAPDLDISADRLDKSDLHVHVPAGATPKDGPSAGVAMYLALVSILTGRVVRSDTAMTGEISLRGLVLPVGGIKEKVVAAARAGLSRVMLPARNRRDFDDIPQDVRDQLTFIWLETVDDALREGLLPADAPAPAVSRQDSSQHDTGATA